MLAALKEVKENELSFCLVCFSENESDASEVNVESNRELYGYFSIFEFLW